MTEKKQADFEQSLANLAALIHAMEQGDLPLNQSLQYFEEGVKLIRQCQETLNQAQQMVRILTETQGQKTLKDFVAHDEP